MRYLTQRIVYLFAVSLLLPLWPAGDADAQFNGALRGEYDITVHRTCASESPVGELPNPILSFVSHLIVQGTTTFDGAGGMSHTGEVLAPGLGTDGTGVSTGAGTEINVVQATDQSCTGTYTVNADGTFSATMTCNFTFNTGPNAGHNATLSGVRVRGKLGPDGTVVVLRNTSALAGDVETLSCPACPFGGTIRRLCANSGLATARR